MYVLTPTRILSLPVEMKKLALTVRGYSLSISAESVATRRGAGSDKQLSLESPIICGGRLNVGLDDVVREVNVADFDAYARHAWVLFITGGVQATSNPESLKTQQLQDSLGPIDERLPDDTALTEVRKTLEMIKAILTTLFDDEWQKSWPKFVKEQVSTEQHASSFVPSYVPMVFMPMALRLEDKLYSALNVTGGAILSADRNRLLEKAKKLEDDTHTTDDLIKALKVLRGPTSYSFISGSGLQGPHTVAHTVLATLVGYSVVKHSLFVASEQLVLNNGGAGTSPYEDWSSANYVYVKDALDNLDRQLGNFAQALHRYNSKGAQDVAEIVTAGYNSNLYVDPAGFTMTWDGRGYDKYKQWLFDSARLAGYGWGYYTLIALMAVECSRYGSANPNGDLKTEDWFSKNEQAAGDVVLQLELTGINEGMLPHIHQIVDNVDTVIDFPERYLVGEPKNIALGELSRELSFLSRHNPLVWENFLTVACANDL